MWSSYLLTLYRSLTRHRLFSALNILGLAVGIAVFLILWLAVRFDLSYDRWIPGAENIYRVDSIETRPGGSEDTYASTQRMVLPLLQADYPQIEQGVRLWRMELAVRQGEQATYEDVVFADPTFFDMFDLPLVAGDPASALVDTTAIVLTESVAQRYFGSSSALGEQLTLTIDGQPRLFRVAAVLEDLPENTHLELGMIARLDPSVLVEAFRTSGEWGNYRVYTYVRVPPDALEGLDLSAFVDRRVTGRGPQPSDTLGYALNPITDIHLDMDSGSGFKPSSDPLMITTLALVGLVTLVIAAVNYVNLSTARAGMRAREVALRKVMGATRRALTIQFLIEAVVVAVVAAAIGLFLAESVLPTVNSALGLPLVMPYFGVDGVLILLAFLALTIGVGAGLYPALVLSKFDAAGVLASSREPSGGRLGARVREALVVLQFAISIILIIATAAIFAQTRFVRNADLGFQREGMIVVERLGGPETAPRRDALLNAYRQLPGVSAVTASESAPGEGSGNNNNVIRPGMEGEAPVLRAEVVAANYFETYGVDLVAGRDFNLANRLDDLAGIPPEELGDRGVNTILNETALPALGFQSAESAIGETLLLQGGGLPATIVGVVRDIRFVSSREAVPATYFLMNTINEEMDYSPSWYGTVRYRGDPAPILVSLQMVWQDIVPSVPFQAETVENALNDYYQPDERRSRLFTVGSVVAVAIGCLGLYGLAAFTATRRTKEIGMRKVLGASTADVVRLMVLQFLRPVLLANLLAWPIAFVAVRWWLSGFNQAIALTPLYFVAGTLLALLVALATVTGHAIRVGRSSPGKALRYE